MENEEQKRQRSMRPRGVLCIMIDNPPLTCRELVELVTDYLEGALAPEDRRRFDAHLAECAACITYLEQMKQTIAALGRFPEESIAPETQQTLLGAFRTWRNQ